MSEIDRKRLATFFGVLVGLAAAFQTASWATGIPMETLGPAYMFTPMLAGLVVVFGFGHSPSEFGARIGRPRWLAGAALIGVLLVGLTLAISLAIPGVDFDPTGMEAAGAPTGLAGLAWTFGTAVVLGVTLNAVMAFGEEFGWRGYLLWELAPLGFWKASAVVGFAWGIWHAPSVLEGVQYESFPYVGLAMMTAACMALSVVYTYVVIRAESMLAAVFLHGIFNGSAQIVLSFTAVDTAVLDQLVANAIGVAGVLACGVFAIVVAARGTPTLDRTHVREGRSPSDPGVAGAD